MGLNHIIINKTLKFIQNNSNYSDSEYSQIEYGLEGVYLTFSKTIIILLIGIIFNYLDIVLLTLLFFNILRFFAFGLHTKRSWHCLILSILQFNVLPFLLLHISINNYIILFIAIFTFISFLLFAPSDTEKRPLTNRKKRVIRKVLAIISAFIFFIIIYFFDFLKVPILCSLLIESLMINPICYKILNLPYKNYKNQA